LNVVFVLRTAVTRTLVAWIWFLSNSTSKTPASVV